MDILKFKVKNSELQRKDKKIISNQSEGTAYIQVTFQKNSDWENQTKFAIFENDKKQQTTVLLGDMQTCLIPIPPLPTAQNSWVDWKTLPYESCNTQHIWVDGGGMGREVRVRVPPNSNKLQVFISEGTGGIRAGVIVYPTK